MWQRVMLIEWCGSRSQVFSILIDYFLNVFIKSLQKPSEKLLNRFSNVGGVD
jgi:hypothetical protein